MSTTSDKDATVEDLEAIGLTTAEFVPERPESNGTAATDSSKETEETQPGRTRRSRQLRRLVLAALLIAAAAFLYDPRDIFDNQAAIEAPSLRDTATVSLTSLADVYETDGNYVYAQSLDVVAAGPPGVITEIVPAGATIERGSVLWRVVDEPTVALFGDTPSHRSLHEGDEGPDVRQLEENLVKLGYDPADTVTVDETFTSNTALMVERWQADIDAEVTGWVAEGTVAYVPGISRVGSTALEVGGSMAPGSSAMTVTAPRRVAEFIVSASQRSTIAIGDNVELQFPDRSSFEAVVEQIDPMSDGGISVTAAPIGQVEHVVDIVPLTVTWSVALGEDVLTVPADAVVRTDDGRYNVEVRSSTGAERLVPIEIGSSAGSTVDIIGDIAAGDVVISP